ncbi:MAG: hypothetical protein LUO89_01995, partial [Methanothrix sp.]|nr:hypothetical protein [Methanothrix sp.]
TLCFILSDKINRYKLKIFWQNIERMFQIKVEISKGDLKKQRAYVQEFSHFLIEQGKLYQDYEMHEEAKSCFKSAIKLLEKDDPAEIKRYGLQSLLAKSLHDIKHEPDQAALKEAQIARKFNPLNHLEHKTLGEIFCDLEEFDYGLEELNLALSWKHDDPDILFRIGWTYFKRAKRCPEKEHRKSELEKAAKYLQNALDLYDKDMVSPRGKTRYWLGKVYLNLGDNHKAIPHFRILYKVKLGEGEKGESGSWLMAALQLARTYFYVKAYDECEDLFEKIIKKDNEIMDKQVIGEALEDEMLPGELLAWAHLGKSFSYAERNQELGGVPNGDRTGKAIWYLDRLKGNDKIEDLESRKRRLNAAINICRGMIHYKLDEIDDAIRLLSLAISESTEALGYLYLAQAYRRQLELKADALEQERSIIKRNALICCSLAIELDFRRYCTKSAEKLQKEISGEEAKEPPKEDGSEATINLEGNAKGTFSWKKPPKEETQEEE